jgi:hypothetical protein
MSTDLLIACSSKGPLTLEFETKDPADIRWIVQSSETLQSTLLSYYVDIIGTLPSSCPAKETKWNGCPDGPCCQVGHL